MSRKDLIDSLITGKGKTVDATYIADLYNAPKPDQRDVAATFPRITPNMWQQCDVLFLPNDKGYEYALVVVDVGSRFVDAEPLKEKTSAAIVTAIQNIYKRKILAKPKLITVDAGKEFKSTFAQSMQALGIDIKTAKVGRHRQVALVERKNQSIGKTIHKLITQDELDTGHSSSKWVEYLPLIIESINTKIKLSTPTHTIKSSANYDPLYRTNDIELLNVGDKVRVPLEEPRDMTTNKKLVGKFRSGDIRWEKKETVIKEVLLKPDQPPMYIVDSQPHVAYTRNQLQLVKGDAPTIKPVATEDIENRYTVKKLLDRKNIKGVVNYLVWWEGLPASSNKSWETRESLIDDIPRLIKNLDAKLDKKNEPTKVNAPVIARTLGVMTRSRARGLR